MIEQQPNSENNGTRPEVERRLKSRIEEFEAELSGINTLEDILFLAGKKLVGKELDFISQFVGVVLRKKSHPEFQQSFLISEDYKRNLSELSKLSAVLAKLIDKKLFDIIYPLGPPEKKERSA